MITLTFFNHTLFIQTYYIFILSAIFIGIAIIWLYAYKDGFDFEKFFDIYFLSILIWLISLLVFRYAFIYYYYLETYKNFFAGVSFFLITYCMIIFKTRKLKWSIYRVLDIFSMVYFAILFSLVIFKVSVLASFTGILPIFFLTIVYLVIFLNRNKTLSGLAFSTFLVCVSIVLYSFLKSTEYLLFYFLLFTISILTLVLRKKRAMFSRNLSKEFINRVKDLLLLKKTRLKTEQKKLLEEDPYLQSGRDTGNAEEVDEAILEDRAKTELEIRKSNLKQMKDQVDKAVEKLEQGEYGICEVCGDPIDKARLEAYPEATKCLRHATT